MTAAARTLPNRPPAREPETTSLPLAHRDNVEVHAVLGFHLRGLLRGFLRLDHLLDGRCVEIDVLVPCPDVPAHALVLAIFLRAKVCRWVGETYSMRPSARRNCLFWPVAWRSVHR